MNPTIKRKSLVGLKKSLIFYFFDNSIVFISHCFVQRNSTQLQAVCYLLKYTMQWYIRWNMNNHMVSEEKTKSTLMSLQDITLLLYFVITGCIDLISTTSSLKSLRIELDNWRLNLNLTKSNWYNGADLMLLSKEEVLSLK